MVQSGDKASATERELRAYSNELGIRRHAERLEADLGTDRPIAVLEQVTRAIAARRAPSPTVIIKATGK